MLARLSYPLTQAPSVWYNGRVERTGDDGRDAGATTHIRVVTDTMAAG